VTHPDHTAQVRHFGTIAGLRVEALKADGVILWPPDGSHQQTPAVMLGYLRDPNLTEAVLAVYEAML